MLQRTRSEILASSYRSRVVLVTTGLPINAYDKSIFLTDVLSVCKLLANVVTAGSLFQSDTTRTGNE